MENRPKRLQTLLILISAFLILTVLVVKGLADGIDLAISASIIRCANPALDRAFYFGRSVGNNSVIALLFSAALVYMYLKRSRKSAVLTLVIFMLLLGTGHGLKGVIKRERPPIAYYRGPEKGHVSRSFAYPSGHALKASFLFLVTAMLAAGSRLEQRARIAAKAVSYNMIILVGLSSIYLGAHWLSDVIGGCILGYVFFLVLGILEKVVDNP